MGEGRGHLDLPPNVFLNGCTLRIKLWHASSFGLANSFPQQEFMSQHVRHLWLPSWIFNNFVLRKTAANFTQINRKYVFAVSNRNIIKNRV